MYHSKIGGDKLTDLEDTSSEEADFSVFKYGDLEN